MGKEREKTQAELDRAAQKKEKADKFWGMFLFTENGKIKSTLIVYSFSLSLLFLAVYFLAFMLLIDPLHGLMEGTLGAPVWAINLVEGLVPALLGTALCCSLFFVFKDKRLVPATYVWLCLYALILLIGMLVQLSLQDWSGFLQLYVLVIPVPVVLGQVVSYKLYARHRDAHPDGPVKEEPAWKSWKGK